MELIFSFFIFLFGLVVGSFLNCVIYRLETEQSFLKGRSFCPHCGYPLAWKDLIPLLSFLILKGKCRYCGEKISGQYPLVELATGTLFLLVAYYFLFPLNVIHIVKTCYLLIVASFLIVIFVYDLKHYIIPDKVIYPAIVFVVLYQFFSFKIKQLGPV